MPTLHLICGLPCSGKTTYANHLRAGAKGAVFTIDDWLITAFGQYSIATVGEDEHTRRVLACRRLIWHSTVELLRRSVDVVLDDGFFFREHRMRYVELATEAGAGTVVHFVDAPIATIRGRLEKRNAHLPPYNFYIDPASLHQFLAVFEPPGADEGAELVVVRTGPGERQSLDETH